MLYPGRSKAPRFCSPAAISPAESRSVDENTTEAEEGENRVGAETVSEVVPIHDSSVIVDSRADVASSFTISAEVK